MSEFRIFEKLDGGSLSINMYPMENQKIRIPV